MNARKGYIPHHRTRAQAIARGAGGVVLNVQHPRQRDAVVGPPAAVGEEEIRLGCAAAGVGVGEVVAAADEAGGGGAGVVGGEARVDVGCAFCCLLRCGLAARC